MSLPTFYVSPEQQSKDRAEFSRSGIAKGRSVIVAPYAEGIVFISENRSKSLHKVAEIYDRIGFAAVGKYNEFEKLRVAGVRYADMRGFAYDRADVSARGLANAYAQILGGSFTVDPKPLEVELVVAQVGESPDGDQIYRLSYDGSVADEPGFVVMGAEADKLRERLREAWRPSATLDEALAVAYQVLGLAQEDPDTSPAPENCEVAVLERDRPRRKFRRLTGAAKQIAQK